jgi:hypothetical protein
MSRPKGSVKAIDLEKVEALASFGCTQDEIAVIMRCCSRTLRETLTGKKATRG